MMVDDSKGSLAIYRSSSPSLKSLSVLWHATAIRKTFAYVS